MMFCSGYVLRKSMYFTLVTSFWAFLLGGAQVGGVMVAYLQTVIQTDLVMSNLQISLIYIYKWVRTFCVVREKAIK